LHSVIKEEWQKKITQSHQGDDMDFEINAFSNGQMTEIDIDEDLEAYQQFLVSIEEALFEEIKREEETLIAQALEYEEQEFNSLIDSHYRKGVICPVCLKGELILDRGLIYCNCGVRVNAQSGYFSLENLEELIKQAFEEHGQQCQQIPVISYQNNPAFQGLVLNCAHCQAFSIVF